MTSQISCHGQGDTIAEEVAALAAFLLGDTAGYINGQIIGIDGGYSA